jgi:hypothetical protein
MLDVILLAPRILRWLLDFQKIYGPLGLMMLVRLKYVQQSFEVDMGIEMLTKFKSPCICQIPVELDQA